MSAAFPVAVGDLLWYVPAVRQYRSATIVPVRVTAVTKSGDKFKAAHALRRRKLELSSLDGNWPHVPSDWLTPFAGNGRQRFFSRFEEAQDVAVIETQRSIADVRDRLKTLDELLDKIAKATPPEVGDQ